MFNEAIDTAICSMIDEIEEALKEEPTTESMAQMDDRLTKLNTLIPLTEDITRINTIKRTVARWKNRISDLNNMDAIISNMRTRIELAERRIASCERLMAFNTRITLADFIEWFPIYKNYRYKTNDILDQECKLCKLIFDKFLCPTFTPICTINQRLTNGSTYFIVDEHDETIQATYKTKNNGFDYFNVFGTGVRYPICDIIANNSIYCNNNKWKFVIDQKFNEIHYIFEILPSL
jgi:hypothetical protein